jgi:CheY-like chemotaxis protein
MTIRMFLNAVHRVLTAEGHVVEDAPKSPAAVALHRANPFDLIITDIVVPKPFSREGLLETVNDVLSRKPE